MSKHDLESPPVAEQGPCTTECCDLQAVTHLHPGNGEERWLERMYVPRAVPDAPAPQTLDVPLVMLEQALYGLVPESRRVAPYLRDRIARLSRLPSDAPAPPHPHDEDCVGPFPHVGYCRTTPERLED